MGIERVIIAKHSPKNQCFADDGELLIAAAPSAKASIRVRNRGHFFVGLTTGKPSLVGWTDTPSQSITEDQIIMQAQQCPHPELLGMMPKSRSGRAWWYERRDKFEKWV